MKKILSVLLLIFVMLLSACGGVKYEFIDGFLYADGKEATGIFEFKLNGYKTRAKYINGLANGLFEEYYPDGSILMKIFNKDGSLVESYDADKNETILYQENGNPFIFTDADPTTYNENNAILPKVENGKEVDSNVITKNLENGLSEIIVDDKVMLRFDDKIGFFISFYPTGEPMYMGNATTSETLIFSKNRKILYKDKGSDFTIYNKDGKPIHELRGGVLIFHNEDGDEIIINSYKVEDIKKID